MFRLCADKNQLAVQEKEPVTSGSVNVYPVQFEFSADWDGLERTAVFKTGRVSRSVRLKEDNKTTVPWEVLAEPGCYLVAGVYGRRGDDLVLPTVWAGLGMIYEGAAPGEESKPPTPELWQQELAGKGDSLSYDGVNLSLMSGNEPLSAVKIEGGGGPACQFGHGLKVTGTTVSVDAVNDFNGDNTLPMTAAGVYSAVGNIEALLGTI